MSLSTAAASSPSSLFLQKLAKIYVIAQLWE